MSELSPALKNGTLAGIKRGWHSFVWICKIVIPVSLAVALLQWTGWLSRIDFILNPVMGLIHLPPEAALPILSGMFLNLYAVIAMITVIPFTPAQMTLIAVFNLIAHGLILEGIIQHRSGLNIVKALVVRVTAAIVAVLIVSYFLGDTSQRVVLPASLLVNQTILEALQSWAIGLILLLLKIFAIVMAVMIILDCARTLGWIEKLRRSMKSVMMVLGLSERTATMWVAAILFGLLFGGAVIVEESKKEPFTPDELQRLHLFIGINHSMIEDPALFAVLGLPPFWLWIPRLLMAVVVVQGYNAISFLRTRLVRQPSRVQLP